MQNAKRIILLIFIFSMPYESWDPFGIANFFTVTKMAGLLYFLLSFADLKANFKLGVVKKTLQILFLLWVWILLQSLFNYHSNTKVSLYSMSFFQNIVLFWLIANDIISGRAKVKQIYAMFALSVFVMSVLAKLEIGIDTELDIGGGLFRLRFFGANSNTIGNYCSIALILIAAMVLDKKEFYPKKTYLFLGMIPTILTMMALTGSRGALGMFFIGVSLLLLLRKTTPSNKVLIIFAGFFILLFSFNKIMESSRTMQNRLAKTTEGDTLGERGLIWNTALDIYSDYPFIGLGTTGYEKEMTQRYVRYMDTHNLFLYFMVTGGIVGLLIYLFFLRELFIGIRYIYKNSENVLPIALFMVYLFNAFKAGGIINSKLMWVLLAIIFASRYARKEKCFKRNAIKIIR